MCALAAAAWPPQGKGDGTTPYRGGKRVHATSCADFSHTHSARTYVQATVPILDRTGAQNRAHWCSTCDAPAQMTARPARAGSLQRLPPEGRTPATDDRGEMAACDSALARASPHICVRDCGAAARRPAPGPARVGAVPGGVRLLPPPPAPTLRLPSPWGPPPPGAGGSV